MGRHKASIPRGVMRVPMNFKKIVEDSARAEGKEVADYLQDKVVVKKGE
jgi:hypothetical protein